LQKKGVIRREIIGPNGKQQTIYSLVVGGDSNNSYPSVQTPWSKPRRPLGSDPLVKTEAQKKELRKETIQKKQQQDPPPKQDLPPNELPEVVVVSSVSSDRSKNTEPPPTQKPNIYQELHPVDIPEDQKIEITRNFTLDQVKHALKCVASSKSPIRCLPAFIKKAAAADWEMQPSEEDRAKINKSYAMRYNGVIVKSVEISTLNKYVEVNNKSHPNGACYIEYDDPNFIPEFHGALRNNNIKVLDIK
jgi:hypothetical protein